ncbi:ribosome silencing factor [uncultured Campylobacter sp.]|uniref:ribosome silencing factor n=1 Tax=uncultured Campylobacter sp. TaxID=218934 RepID=UPI00261FF133|nr:ribosome silencing factor [uncultured Campylobacter sp.]
MKIALFGGSFDPPHAGHDAAVRAILSSLKPDLLVIMPSFLNPFKKSFSAAPQLRLKWCRTLWGDAPHVEVSDYEISQNRPVPTIQSVKFLLEKYGGNDKITSETAVAASETQSTDKISSAASSRASGAVMSEISNSIGDKISSASKIPSAARNEISSAATGKFSSASEIPNGNANCMADAGSANFMGSAYNTGDTGDANCMNVANDVHDASDVSNADEASKANSASDTDTTPKLYIVVGADNLSELHKWRDFSELQKLAEFAVLTRPGYEIPRQWASLRRIEITVDASSSGFRRDFKGEIPPKIAAEVIKFYKRKDMQDPKQRAEKIAEILNEKKAEDVQIIDMEGREYIAKLVVIATMLTARHAASLIEELKSVLKPLGEEFLAIESGDEWSVVDLGDIIVHLISETYRAKYNIEDFLDKLKKEQF